MADSELHEKQMLLAMYNVFWDNINRHLVIIWQPVALLVASLGSLSMAREGVITVDLATGFATGAGIWFIAHIMDASNWFNRNQQLIGKLEKLTLSDEVRRDIGWPIGEIRGSKPIGHYVVQYALGWFVISLMLLNHVLQRVLPDLRWLGLLEVVVWF